MGGYRLLSVRKGRGRMEEEEGEGTVIREQRGKLAGKRRMLSGKGEARKMLAGGQKEKQVEEERKKETEEEANGERRRSPLQRTTRSSRYSLMFSFAAEKRANTKNDVLDFRFLDPEHYGFSISNAGNPHPSRPAQSTHIPTRTQQPDMAANLRPGDSLTHQNRDAPPLTYPIERAQGRMSITLAPGAANRRTLPGSRQVLSLRFSYCHP
ncbi:hypothetical protein BHE74_00009308 [Ensete ventricosum]|nr:hypothetical protein BHE74_00009308 [Ensete ventricosum]